MLSFDGGDSLWLVCVVVIMCVWRVLLVANVLGDCAYAPHVVKQNLHGDAQVGTNLVIELATRSRVCSTRVHLSPYCARQNDAFTNCCDTRVCVRIQHVPRGCTMVSAQSCTRAEHTKPACHHAHEKYVRASTTHLRLCKHVHDCISYIAVPNHEKY